MVEVNKEKKNNTTATSKTLKAEKVHLPVLTQAGEDTGRRIELLSDPFFIEPNKHVLTQYILSIRSHQRQGTAKTKEKSEVNKSTRKLYRQKGTGRARAGSAKSGIRRGGGTIHGPRPRNYQFDLNKKEKHLAKKSALSIKAHKQQLIVIEDFSLEKPATKNYLKLLGALSLNKQKNLWIYPDLDKNMLLSIRNVAKNKITTVDQVNGLDLLSANKVILIESAVPLLIKKFI